MPGILRFGVFEFDRDAMELPRNGVPYQPPTRACKVGFSVCSPARQDMAGQVTDNPVFQALRYAGRASPGFELE